MRRPPARTIPQHRDPGLDPEPVDPATPVAGPVGTDEAALALSAGQQVTAALSGLAGASGSADDTTVGDAGSLGVSATPGAAPAGKVTATADGGREIVVKLDPEHLGSVQIRLKMNGEKVDVSITVDNPSTLNLLNQDRHLLTSAVSALGLGSGPLLLSPGGSRWLVPAVRSSRRRLGHERILGPRQRGVRLRRSGRCRSEPTRQRPGGGERRGREAGG